MHFKICKENLKLFIFFFGKINTHKSKNKGVAVYLDKTLIVREKDIPILSGNIYTWYIYACILRSILKNETFLTIILHLIEIHLKTNLLF